MRFSHALLGVVGVVAQLAAARRGQKTLDEAGRFDQPVSSLSTLQPGHDFVTITHNSHPDHRVRIKAHDGWCETKARSYTGYIDAGDGKQLFFYFFESRHKPKEDPVAMWINGGPGGSSAMGLFMEQGPCRVKEKPQSPNDTYTNPYAWNERANVFFLDEPIGVGFSHGEHGQVVGRTEVAALDIAAFVDIFFDTFKEYRGRAFHMTGESYGGRYLPVFASAVYDHNAKIVAEGRTPINLKSVMIGNGGTSLFKLVESQHLFMCTKQIDLGYTVLDIKKCVSLAENVPKCHKNLKKYCIDTSDYTSCSMWFEFCNELWAPVVEWTGRSRYNINQTCTPAQMAESLCMPAALDLERYLNLPAVRDLLGVDNHVPEFKLSSHLVAKNFGLSLDFTHQTYYYVANLLERGIKVLNYVGTLDAACDHIGQELWMNEMPWTGRDGYLAAPTEDWVVDGHVAGTIKSFGDLTLQKVYGAGHLVPTDKPKEALELFNTWVQSCE